MVDNIVYIVLIFFYNFYFFDIFKEIDMNFFLFSSSPANAVRNRAKIVQGFIIERLVQLSNISVTSIASGPAREVNETVKKIPKNEKTEGQSH